MHILSFLRRCTFAWQGLPTFILFLFLFRCGVIHMKYLKHYVKTFRKYKYEVLSNTLIPSTYFYSIKQGKYYHQFQSPKCMHRRDLRNGFFRTIHFTTAFSHRCWVCICQQESRFRRSSEALRCICRVLPMFLRRFRSAPVRNENDRCLFCEHSCLIIAAIICLDSTHTPQNTLLTLAHWHLLHIST